MDDVHSGSRVDGDGEVVGRHVEGERAIRQDIQLCLLVVVSRVTGRRGRTYKYDQNNAEITLFFQVELVLHG